MRSFFNYKEMLVGKHQWVLLNYQVRLNLLNTSKEPSYF